MRGRDRVQVNEKTFTQRFLLLDIVFSTVYDTQWYIYFLRVCTELEIIESMVKKKKMWLIV